MSKIQILHVKGKKERKKGREGQGVATLISHRPDFRARKLIRDEEGCYIMIDGLNPQEDVIVFDMYTPNQRAARGTDESTKTTGDFSTLHQKWTDPGASLVAQWLRICLPMQGTRV